MSDLPDLPDVAAMQDRFRFTVMVADNKYDAELMARLPGNTLPICDLTAHVLGVAGQHRTTVAEAAAAQKVRRGEGAIA